MTTGQSETNCVCAQLAHSLCTLPCSFHPMSVFPSRSFSFSLSRSVSLCLARIRSFFFLFLSFSFPIIKTEIYPFLPLLLSFPSISFLLCRISSSLLFSYRLYMCLSSSLSRSPKLLLSTCPCRSALCLNCRGSFFPLSPSSIFSAACL